MENTQNKYRLSFMVKSIIPIIFLSSQTYPDNPFRIISAICFVCSLLYYFLNIQNFKLKISSQFLIPLCVFIGLLYALIIQYQSFSAPLLTQFFRIIYPWMLVIIYVSLTSKFRKSLDFSLSIFSYSTICLYFICLPDIIFLIYSLLNNVSMYALKGSALIYPETNTLAYLLVFNLIIRIENRLAYKFELPIVLFIIIAGISRSSVLLLLSYIFIKIVKYFINKNKYIFPQKTFSRLLPILTLIGLFIMKQFLSTSFQKAELISLADNSFQARLSILDYLSYFFNELKMLDIGNLLFGFGWLGKERFIGGVTGTSGHTLLGMIPELGLLYMLFLFLIFYRDSWRGKLHSSLILSLSIFVFIPISYVAPIFCLIFQERVVDKIRLEGSFDIENPY